MFDYQSERHRSKTRLTNILFHLWFDYQSERHRSKTWAAVRCRHPRLITSQNDTAPKQGRVDALDVLGLITSQNDTAPKPIEAKSPLQGTALLASIYHSTFYKVQVNHSFTLVIINHIIRPSLEKKYWNIRKKDVLEERFQPPFR